MINFAATRADIDIIMKIMLRAEPMAIEVRGYFDRQTCYTDITATHLNGCPLKLQALLDADDFNFAHDVFGIERHIDRRTGKLGDCFLPRFADLRQGDEP